MSCKLSVRIKSRFRSFLSCYVSQTLSVVNICQVKLFCNCHAYLETFYSPLIMERGGGEAFSILQFWAGGEAFYHNPQPNDKEQGEDGNEEPEGGLH